MSEHQSTKATFENPKAVVQSTYDLIAPTYLAWSAPRPTETRAAYIKRLVDLLPPSAKILELGCGAGVPSTQSIAAHESAFHITGVDISESQVQLAREHVGGGDVKGKVEFIRSDMMEFEVAEGSYDAVLAFYSVFHLPAPEQGPMMAKMVTWLKPGGFLLFNLNTKAGDSIHDDWMGGPMFSSGLGIDGNREAMGKALEGKGVKVIEDEVAIEYVGRFEEKFHWFFAQKDSM